MSSETNLPDCWSRPFPSLKPIHFQRTLFEDLEPETKPEDVLAELKVSTSDMERWHRNGWISYRIQDLDHFVGPDENEIRFVAPIARSGLSDSQITQLFKELRAPYAYADGVAYHFKYGWVTPPPVFDIVSSNVDDCLDQLAEEDDSDRLLELGNKIYDLLHPAEDEEEDEEEADEQREDVSAEDNDHETRDTQSEETTICSGALKFIWHEVSEIPNGHGIELHDIGIFGEGIRLSEKNLVGFIEGFEWRHRASKDVVAYCISPSSRTPESVLTEMKATVEDFVSKRRILPENITSRIRSCMNC